MTQDFERYGAMLQSLGVRITPQRVMILEVIQESHGHMTAEAICEKIRSRYPYINAGTVYRTLELFSAVGLVAGTDMGDKRIHYEFRDTTHHHHLVCEKCGQVSELPDTLLSPIRESLLRHYHFQARVEHMAIFGTCEQCLSKQEGQATAASG